MSLTAVIAALLLVGAGCSSKEIAEEPASPKPPAAVAAAPESSASARDASVKEFAITASNWKFEPDEIRVRQGDKVRFTVTSVDVAHGFAISEYNIKLDLRPGKTVGAEFTADKKGTFPFFCAVFCGEGHRGMRGQMVVE